MSEALGLKPYQRVVGASGLSNLSDGIRFVALPLLTVQISERPSMLALVLAAGQAPWLVFGLWAGQIVDRVDRHLLAKRTMALRLTLLLGLVTLILAGAVSIPVLVAGSFLLGIGEVMSDNVSGTLIPSLVPPEDLERANSRMVGAEIIGNELAGPALGGLLFGVATMLPFAVNAVLLTGAVILLAGLPQFETESTDGDEAGHKKQEIGDGIRVILGSPLLRTLAWSNALLAAIDGAWFALLALLVTVELGLDGFALGLFLTVGAVGGLAGTVLASKKPNLALPAVATFTFASMAAPLIVLGLYPGSVLTVVTLFVGSAAFALWNVFTVSARQRATSNEMMGRVGAAYRTLTVTASMIGVLAGGAFAEAVSFPATLIAAGLCLAVAAPFVLIGFTRATRAE